MRSTLLLALSLALLGPSLTVATSSPSFYHYPCAKIDHATGKSAADDWKCKEGTTLSSGLVVPYDMHCAYDREEKNYYCGAVNAVCSKHDCAHGLVCKKTARGKRCVHPTPQPSSHAVVKRTVADSEEQRRDRLCPHRQTACPLAGGRLGYECVDVETSLEQCGGCQGAQGGGGGMDCTTLQGVESVSCVDGACRVWTCQAGFFFHYRKKSCIPQQQQQQQGIFST